MKKSIFVSAFAFLTSAIASTVTARAAELKVNDVAPPFTVKTHDNETFDLAKRAGQWTVLYFYPKADTPGCTKQACAFRDNIEKIRAQGAEIYGISIDTVEAQKAFRDKHHLNFTLLADADGAVVEKYGSKMPVMKISRRWTFIIDPKLQIRAIEKDVDPAHDAEQVAALITKLKGEKVTR